MNPFYEDIIIAGFGGQGILFIGKLLAYAVMKEGRNVTWIPSYGPEMRGGTANCTVVISDEEIGSPVITAPHSLIIMNNPSLEAFETRLKPDGLLVINTSLVTLQPKRTDINIIRVPANKIAIEVGNDKVANMVMLGAYIAKKRTVAKESILEALKKVLGPQKEELFQLNKTAFERGMEIGSM